MKKNLHHQLVNIVSFLLVILLPFALSSQTRKAIPAGRYESLSGVKSLKSKQAEVELNDIKKDEVYDFWLETISNFGHEETELNYFAYGLIDKKVLDLLDKRNFKLVQKLNSKALLIYADNFSMVKAELLKVANNKTFILLNEKSEINELVKNLNEFEIVIYRLIEGQHYYLLRFKINK